MRAPAADAVLDGFSEATSAWFRAAFSEPTAAQSMAWSAIGRGENTLVIAPTGSGKTLAAFLWAIDKLAAAGVPDDPQRRCRVLYISPLKALAVDIERNLRSPLTGIRHAAHRLGLAEPDIRVGVRTGDTAADERRKLSAKPPDILITTPESLFLLLTSRARETLRGVETVILDEVHALAGSKRGAHLALSLERLDALRGSSAASPAGTPSGSLAGTSSGSLAGTGSAAGPALARTGAGATGSAPGPPGATAPAQRIGLSATVRPPQEVAAFLGGARPVTVVQPPSDKRIELQLIVPVEDMADLETAARPAGACGGGVGRGPDARPARARPMTARSGLVTCRSRTGRPGRSRSGRTSSRECWT